MNPITAIKNEIVRTEHKVQKLFWMFLIASLLGDLLETVYVWARSGVLMSRSSLLWGPFSVVWGFGAMLLTVCLYQLQGKEDRYIFLGGAALGGAYEYLCSVLSELVFGTVFWDYSEMPLNLNGRINLLYCFFWGIAGLVWVKHLYPLLARLIEWVSGRVSITVTTVLMALMLVNMLFTAGALIRYGERRMDLPAENRIEQFFDTHFDDARLEERYPNMIVPAD